MANMPTIAEKCTGSILASAIGDALGWPNELRSNNTIKNSKASSQFIEWTRRSGGRYWFYIEKILPGEYSDDTQMILAVARSIITGDWESTLVKKELPYWLEYERGGGRALKNAAKLLKNNVFPWESKENREYFMAGGNGAAMRILPHVIVKTRKQDINALISEVIKDSLYTHGHPRAILGASCYAFALQYLMNKDTVLEYGELIRAVIDGAKFWNTLNPDVLPTGWLSLSEKYSGFDYSRVWSETVSSMIEKLEFISESLNKGLLVNDNIVLKHLECFDKTNGAGDVAILSSLYLASKYANNPALGIKTAANLLGADTDTIASMTGGLLGMLSGTSWIPTEWKLVQDYECLTNIAEILLADNMTEASKHISNKYKIQYNGWKDSPIGKIRSLSTSVVPNSKSANVIIEKIETMLGQTLYIKRFERNRIIDSSKKEQEIKAQPIVNKPIIHRATFLIDCNNIQELLGNPLVERITFKKVLKIIDLLINGDLSCPEVANKLNVNENVVKVIKMQIK